MLELILIIISSLVVVKSLDMPPLISSVSSVLLLIEHIALIFSSRILINYEFKRQQLKYRRIYFLFFLIGYTISLIYIYYFWIPDMIRNYSTGWDTFDPIKYYAMSKEMVSGGSVLGSLYFPVVYIYYIEMLILGVHPLIPLFVNQFFYLYAVIILAKFINSDNSKHLQRFAILLLIPEALYFGVTSSKDILCLLCATIIFVHSQKILLKDYSILNYLIASIAFLVLFIARTGMAMMAILSVIMFFFNFKKLRLKHMLFLFVGGGVFLIATNLFNSIGIVTTVAEVSEKAEGQISGDMSFANELSDQKDNAFANKLIPHNPVEFVVFGVIRSVVYAMLSPSDLHIFIEPQNFALIYNEYYTSLLMTISWPIIIYVFIHRKKYMNESLRRLFYVTMLYVMSVGIFNPMIIHRRYRLVYSLLFLALALKSWYIIKSSKTQKEAEPSVLS